MDNKADVSAASFAFSVNMLKMLVKLGYIDDEEFERIKAISAEHYGVKK